jgi:hypothetical protein
MELHLAESVSVFNGEEFCKKVPFSELSRLARDVRSKWMSSTLARIKVNDEGYLKCPGCGFSPSQK